MTPWSPFRGAPMDGEEIRTNAYRCYVCGERIVKGERAFRARSLKVSEYGNPSFTVSAFPTHDGKISLHQTYRHRGCIPT